MANSASIARVFGVFCEVLVLEHRRQRKCGSFRSELTGSRADQPGRSRSFRVFRD